MTVALVTGGSRGIGRACALALAAAGHTVAVNFASNQSAADETVAAIDSAGGSARAYQADVGSAEDVAAMFSAIADELGSVSVLVNNAGITRDGLLLRMSEEDWSKVMRTNLDSVFHCTKAALRPMVRNRWGRIISISSVAGIAGNPGQANYAASKAGVIGFTKSIAKEVGGRGITANVVAPGFIATDMTDALGDDAVSVAVESIAVGRLGEPGDVAGAVAFLASEDAGYITGQTITVDGGLAL